LHQLAKEPGLAALACYDRDGNMFQVWAHQRRYAVEWQVLPARDFNLHRIWVAGRPIPTQRRSRFGSLEVGLELFSRELLEMAEVYGLWASFLAGEKLPSSHVWRDVTRELDSPGQPPRHRPKMRRRYSQVTEISSDGNCDFIVVSGDDSLDCLEVFWFK
jgi:hypothetical protein